jgi:hypothetical protein
MLSKSSLLVLPFLMCIAVSVEAGAATHETTKTATPSSASAAESQKTKSFREWKSEKVQDALGKVTATRIQIAKTKDPNLNRPKGTLEAASGSGVESLEDQLEQDQTALEMTKDLSVTDYFVGYLTKLQNKKAAFNEVAGKLTAEEVAELMAAYANSVFGTHSSDLAPSASVLSADRVK